MPDQKNYILAIVLSLTVLIGWQFIYVAPRTQSPPAGGQPVAERPVPAPQQPGAQAPGAPTPGPVAQAPGGVQAPAGIVQTREAALAQTPRLPIDTPALSGSINLRGGRIDDLSLRTYHETVEASSPNIVLFSPSGSPNPYYAEFGWVGGAAGATPGPETVWTASAAKLTLDAPVTLTWDNGQGLVFRRTITVDDRYMFSVSDVVENRSGAAATLNPYGLVSRHGKPKTLGFFILHEGFFGVFGEAGLKEYSYDDVTPTEPASLDGRGGWFGITDKYWAATLIPDQAAPYKARFVQFQTGATPTFQSDFLREAVVVPAGETREAVTRLFAGAKEVKLVDRYSESLNVLRFDLMIDWGWFRFLTKPMFYGLDYIYRAVGNFGVAILIITILLKMAFLPLAYRSFVSMSKMKKFQPEMKIIQDKFKDDPMKQRQAMMDLYKKQNINPISGCLPILLQIPVFFALYKVLFVTIEMRHAPFAGWIRDLSAPDPTSLFNLFGLIPWTPPYLLMIGAWPLLMGATMWVQMRLNPTPPDPVQQAIFNWMPLIFTYMLSSFPAGLVIYWTWNNFLSIAQQWAIMRREGVEVDLWGNVASSLRRQKPKEASTP